MDRITLIADDDNMLVDGEPRKVDLTSLRERGVHAIQYYSCDVRKRCKVVVEWKQDPLEAHKLNSEMTKVEFNKEFGWCMECWEKAPDMPHYYARKRADRRVADVESLIEEAKEEGGLDDAGTAKMNRALENRKRERDAVYKGDSLYVSSSLVGDDD